MALFRKYRPVIKQIDNIIDLQQRVIEYGFLPMFTCAVPGYSVYEATPTFWRDDEDGPWEWKGPVIREGQCAYGKFLNRKATWISLEWLPHFINYRRSLRLAPNDDMAALDEIVLQTIEVEGPITSKELGAMLGLTGKRAKRTAYDLVDDTPVMGKVSLDPIIGRLMMEGRVAIADFVYNIDRQGNPYGWGVAKYATPEQLYSQLRVEQTPEESLSLMARHIAKVVPSATYAQIKKLLVPHQPKRTT